MKVAYLRQTWCLCEHFSFFFSFQSRSFAQWHREVLCIASRTSLWWAHPQARAAELFGSLTEERLVGSLFQTCSGLPCPAPHPAAQCHLPALPALSFPSLLPFYKWLKPQTFLMIPLLKIQKWLLWFNTTPLGRVFPHCWPELHLVHIWFLRDSCTFPCL